MISMGKRRSAASSKSENEIVIILILFNNLVCFGINQLLLLIYLHYYSIVVTLEVPGFGFRADPECKAGIICNIRFRRILQKLYN
jgi:hypothetical protein